jgi:hypothetical protein
MTALPESQHSTVSAIYKNYEKVADTGQRPHLGASELGHECERYLWLSFRWAKQPGWEGRMLRLFESGNREEPRLIENLRAIGVEVWDKDENGQQFRYTAIGGHVGGSQDGVALGLPEAPKTPHLLEFKTSNNKSFSALVKNGVMKAKAQHWSQMQLYMGWASLDRAMYLVVNKDTDEIYSERIEFDQREFDRLLARAERIVTATEPAITIGENAEFFSCRFCRFKDQCYGTDAPEVNCRTCIHATAEMDGDHRWSCAWHKRDLSVDEQRNGCEHHRHMPSLLARFATVTDADLDGNIQYVNTLTGAGFSQPNYTSKEITAAESKQMLGEPFVDSVKEEFGAAIIPANESPMADLVDDLPWAEKAPAKKAWRKK